MKILIFGIVASGKTTLAKKLSEKLSIPYFEGDCIAWGFPEEKRFKRSNLVQLETINTLNMNKSWIIEGTYRESQKILYDYADKIIFLDTPLYIRIYRIITRFVRQKMGLEACHYHSNFTMLKCMFKWTKDFERNRHIDEERLMNYNEKLIWIKWPKELDERLFNKERE